MNSKILLIILFCLLTRPVYGGPLNVERLADQDARTVDSFLEKLTPLIEKKKAQNNANLLTFDELYGPLNKDEKKLLKKIQRLKPPQLKVKTPRQKQEKNAKPFVEVTGQKIRINGERTSLPPQAVSPQAYEAYEKMMQAMEKEIGKRFYIESAHRGKPYHLYNFVKYLREHNYSLIETAKLNALPGYSEHNLLTYHAIDLINEDGINGEPDVKDYEALPEYQWMLKHAADYGFTLSYPRGNPYGISFEPWHWRYHPGRAKKFQAEKKPG